MYEIAKRIFDVTASSCALVLLIPVLLISKIIIFIDDPKGSPIFTQIRIGKDGKPFKMYKLRTMKVDAEKQLKDVMYLNESDEVVFKIKDDPRMTRVGSFFRKTSIDELPQLVNVIKGDMSIVGPRPALPREVEHYTPRQKRRLECRPGLTCYWQVSPNRNDISFNDWVEMDIKYIENRNFIEDLKIIFKTFGAIFNEQGR